MEDEYVSSASLALLKGKSKTAAATAAAELDKPKTETKAPEAAKPKTGGVTFGKKAAPKPVEEEPKVVETPEPEPTPEPETATETAADDGESVTVDVDKMSAKELDGLVAEHEIETPAEWKGWKVADKRRWLNEQFAEADADQTETVADAVEEAEVVKETPAPEKKGSKVPAKTTAAAAKALSGEVLAPDELSDMVQDIENLKEGDAKKLIKSLAENVEFSFFKLGGVLSVVQANGWFAPYASFREYIETEHGIEYRKALYWVGIYNELTESKVPWAKVKHLGWTKLKEIAGIISNDNVDKWIEIAENNTALKLIEIVKASKKGTASVSDQTSTTVTTKTFKVHEDQKKTIETAIAKAKEQSGTEVDTAALEFICLDFIGGGKKVSLKDQLVKLGIEKALNIVAEAFPQAEINVNLPE